MDAIALAEEEALCKEVGGEEADWTTLPVANKEGKGLSESMLVRLAAILGDNAADNVAESLKKAERVTQPLRVAEGVATAVAADVSLGEAGAEVDA